jgi:hypothetical protein
LALRRWSESRNAAVIEDFLLAHGEEILHEIGEMISMETRSEVVQK